LPEHTQITEMNKKGYVGKPQESEGSDYFGNELLPGDDVVEFDGEVVLRDNLYEFLEAIGFTFKTL
jgi:hypothetical protein